MRKSFTLFFALGAMSSIFAQWKPAAMKEAPIRSEVEYKGYYSLDINSLRQQLKNAKEAGKGVAPVFIDLPTTDGKMERFQVYSFPVVVKELADKYKLGSYAGVSTTDPSKYLRFSLAPNDFQSMIIQDGEYEFIEPVGASKTVYGVYNKTKRSASNPFVCSTTETSAEKKELERLYNSTQSFANNAGDFSRNSDKKYRTMRLAMSVTGEYTQYFGGTVAGALAAINATLTRCNGVFEKDFALHLNLQNFPNVIYTDPNTDPYSPAAQMNNWNLQLQQTLTANVGNANYDIGHLFGASGGGGNAGCIGCVCIDPTSNTSTQKGSGFTSPANGVPQGDTFDIDYVAHEIGHQLGANHTFSQNLEGTGVNQEPGSGSTIMGYAGITGPNTDVQANSDAYFHIASIKQVQANLINKTCDIEVNTTNNPPVIAALPTYNIPKATAFVLTGSATDQENDPMTYTWEEVDNATVTINRNNLGNTTSGASFRSNKPTTNPTRYFPKFSSVMAGVLDNSNFQWESASKVARNSKFAFVVRDNNPVPTQQQTQFAEQSIIVGNDGPFRVTSTQVFNDVPTSPITWDVVNTTNAPYNVANVSIDYTLDNGTTWTVLSASTPNDGSEDFDFTAFPGNLNMKVRVSSIGNVFYAVGPVVVKGNTNCNMAAPTNVTVSNITPYTADVTWTAVLGVAQYRVNYKKATDTTWMSQIVTTNATTLSTLDPITNYEVKVAVICDNNDGTFSSPVPFTTLSDCMVAGPKNLLVSSVTSNSAIVTWNPTPNVTTYMLRYRAVGATNWTVVTLTTTTYLLNNLLEDTDYEVQVANVCDFLLTGIYTSSYIFTTPVLEFCDMSSMTPGSEYISKVSMKSMFTATGNVEAGYSSGASSYTDYTGDILKRFSVMAGSSDNELSIEKSWASTVYNEGVTVWMDFNRNGVFELSEIIMNSAPNQVTPVKTTFTVPADAHKMTSVNDYITMRVAMKRNGAPIMCQDMAYGEVEDYAVYVHDFRRTVGLNYVDNVLIYPNPVQDYIYVTKVANGAKFKIYNTVGQLVMDGAIMGRKIYAGKLQKGVYVIDIDDNGNAVQHKFIKN